MSFSHEKQVSSMGGETGREPAAPIFKWAGGKRWFIKGYSHFIPKKFSRYYEPFLGSGVVFFSLSPDASILADTNSELINAYTALKERPELVERYLKQHSKLHSTAYYYKIREHEPISLYASAARTIYLNRTCWNALYRVNLKGKFNVPKGTKDSVLLNSDDFYAVSRTLKNAKLLVSDFEPVISDAMKGDFVFVDPPYTVKHNVNGFIKYNEKIFSWDDQVRLRNTIEKCVSRGVKVLMTNADHESIRELYRDFYMEPLSRASVISGLSSGRGKYTELVIRCW